MNKAGLRKDFIKWKKMGDREKQGSRTKEGKGVLEIYIFVYL